MIDLDEGFNSSWLGSLYFFYPRDLLLLAVIVELSFCDVKALIDLLKANQDVLWNYAIEATNQRLKWAIPGLFSLSSFHFSWQ